MIKYSLFSDGNDSCVHLEKDYRLNLIRKDKDIFVVKRNSLDKKDFFDDSCFSISGNLTSNDVYTQLANIKHIGFEVTDSCNLQCTYCIYGKFYKNHDARNMQKMDVGKAKMLIDFLVDKVNSPANTSSVNVIFISFYGGEPLLNMDFIQEVVHYTQQIQNHHIMFRYMMTTNAVYLKKFFSFLLKYDFILTVSLDGNEENDGYRKFSNGKPSFKVVYNNLKYIQRKYPVFFKENVQFNSVVHNLNNHLELFSFIYDEFGKISRFSTINPTGVKDELRDEFVALSKPKDVKKTTSCYKRMIKILDLDSEEIIRLYKLITHYSGNVFNYYNDLIISRKMINHLPTATCLPFSKRVFMTVNNKIFPCERIGHQYALGEVVDTGINIDCKQIAEKYNSYFDSLRKLCLSCYHNRYCTQCLFDIDDLDGKPFCNQKGTMEQLQWYLNESLKTLYNTPFLYRRIMTEIIEK